MDEETLKLLFARQEISQLASRYAIFLDARDIDQLVDLYVPDVRVGRDLRGHDALRSDFQASLGSVGVTFLHVGNHLIDLQDDDHATGIVYCRGEIQVGTRWIQQAIQYHDRYQRVDERWLFVRRKHLLVYGADLGENPLELPPANWPAHHTGRGTLPESLETWQRFWSESPPE